MIDPQARPASYFKLMALVVVLGVISALVTFAFIVLVNQSTYRIWEEAAQTLGMDVRLFTHSGLHRRRLAGRPAGEALRRSQRYLCRFDERIRQDRPLRLSQCPRDRDHRLRVAHLRRQPRPRSAAGGRLRRHRDVGLRQAQARSEGDADAGLFRRQQHARRLHHVAVRRGAVGPGIGARRGRRSGGRISGCSFPVCWDRLWQRRSSSC